MTLPVPVAPHPIGAQEFQEMLDRVERLLKQVDSGVQRLFDNCNRVLQWLPDFVSGPLVSALQRLSELISRFFAEMAKIFLNPGWPPGLLSAAGDWSTRVGGPVSALAGYFTADQMRSDNKWQGPAAEAYQDILPTQQAAVEGIKQLTDALDTNLTKIGWGIVALWVGLAVAIGSFVIEIIAEAGAAATVVGAPPAAAAAGVSTAKVVALVGAIVGAFLTYVGLVVDAMSSMRQQLHSNEAYPGGRWPRSTTGDFNDGSLSDGDGTDWRMKY